MEGDGGRGEGWREAVGAFAWGQPDVLSPEGGQAPSSPPLDDGREQRNSTVRVFTRRPSQTPLRSAAHIGANLYLSST